MHTRTYTRTHALYVVTQKMPCDHQRCVKAGVIQGFIAFVVEYARGYAGTPTGKVDLKPLQLPATQSHVGVPTLSLLLSHFCLELAASGIGKLVSMG